MTNSKSSTTIDSNFSHYLKEDPSKWSQLAFDELPEKAYLIRHILEADTELEKIAPGKLKVSLEAALKSLQKRDCFCDNFQEEIMSWFLKNEKEKALPILATYKEHNLAWRLGLLQTISKKLKVVSNPLLSSFLTPTSFDENTSEVISKSKFIKQVLKEIYFNGGIKETLKEIISRFQKEKSLYQDLELYVVNIDQVIPAKKDLIAANFLNQQSWKAQLLLFLDLSDEDWGEKRKRIEYVCKNILSSPVAIQKPEWVELYYLIVNVSVNFSNYSKEIYGKSVKPEEDEGGLIEEYVDCKMYTFDLAFTLLGISEVIKLKEWKKLTSDSFEKKFEYISIMSVAVSAMKKLLKTPEVKKHAAYSTIMGLAKKAYPYD